MTNARNVSVLVIGLLALLPMMAHGQDLIPQPPPPGAPQPIAPQEYAPQPSDPNVMPPPSGPQGYAPQASYDPSVMPPPAAAPQQAVYTQQQLDQLIAPIALYPDPLIAQIMMASTYPLEIVEAERWRQDPQNVQLQGPQLQTAVDQQPWDPSVKSLVAFPQVLSMMNNNLQWTEQLGDAFLASQPALMNEVQNLRQKAQAAGHLASTPQEAVVQQQGDIVIQPANPQVVYVPYYNPMVVYGPWPWVAYPPYYFPPPPGYIFATVGLIGFGFGIAIVDGLWGWGHWDWHRHGMFIDGPRWAAMNHGYAPRFAGGAWAHDPGHRHGVPYRNAAVRQQFQGAATQARQNYRGYFNAAQNRTAGNVHAAAATGGQRTGTPGAGQSAARSFGSESRAPASETRGSTSSASSRSTASATQGRSAQQRPTQQRSAPMFESFSRGTDVRMQAARGSSSRASMSSASHSAPQSHTSGSTGGRGGQENKR